MDETAAKLETRDLGLKGRLVIRGPTVTRLYPSQDSRASMLVSGKADSMPRKNQMR